MILFYSGFGVGIGDVTKLFCKGKSLMLTYWDSHGKPKPEKRFRLIKKVKHKKVKR